MPTGNNGHLPIQVIETGMLRRLWRDISRGHNLDLVATVIVAFAISVLHLVGIVSLKLVLSITLAILGLIAVGLLTMRYKLESLSFSKSSPNVVHLLREQPPSLSEHLKHSKDIWMLGLMLRGTLLDNLQYFEENAAYGLTIRAMIVNPNKVNLQEVAKRFAWANEEDLRKDLQLVLSRFNRLAKTERKEGSIQLRLLPFMAPFSLYIFPREAEGGVIYVETYGYKSPGSVPRYVVTERENPEWYAHFVKQFGLLWDDAEAASTTSG